jgi:tRNA threonylcarbamoyladenosine biosynthesis protein TsaB
LSDAPVLAVDTTFGACSAAVMVGERVLASRFVVMARGHAEALAPMVEDVMEEAGLEFAELGLLAVTTGPGSFTGQRVGLAFMRGLKVALKKPLAGVTSTAAMAQQALAESGLKVAAAVHDAKRGEVYFESTAGHDAQILPVADAVALLTPFASLALAGTAAPAIALSLPLAQVLAITAPDARWVARLAQTITGPATPRPLYLRPPDAKLPKQPETA